MQSRHHQHVVRRRLLKRGDGLGFDEAAVAQKHGPQHRRALRLRREQRIEPREQVAARSREPLQKSWPRPVDQLQQFAAAQRAGQIDSSAARDSRAGRMRRDRENCAAAARARAPRRGRLRADLPVRPCRAWLAVKIRRAGRRSPQRVAAARFHALRDRFRSECPQGSAIGSSRRRPRQRSGSLVSSRPAAIRRDT